MKREGSGISETEKQVSNTRLSNARAVLRYSRSYLKGKKGGKGKSGHVKTVLVSTRVSLPRLTQARFVLRRWHWQ